MAESTSGAAAPQIVDRSVRLRLFGVIATLLGALSILLGLVQLVLPSLSRTSAELGTAAVDWRTTLSGVLLNAAGGLLLIWLGAGSFRMRRWVAPLMRIVGWTWLLGGLLGLVMVWTMLDGLIELATTEGEQLEASVEMLVRLFIVGIVATFGVVLPALFVWIYSDHEVTRTCRRHDRRPAWTERCPQPVLGLSVVLGLLALVSLPMLARPVVPLFGRLIVGRPGALLVLAGLVAMIWLARSTYRLEPRGFWLTALALILLGISTAWTFARVEPSVVYAAMGYPEEQLRALGDSGAMGRGFNIWITIGFTVLSLVYLAAIHKHFRRSPVSEDPPRPT